MLIQGGGCSWPARLWFRGPAPIRRGSDRNSEHCHLVEFRPRTTHSRRTPSPERPSSGEAPVDRESRRPRTRPPRLASDRDSRDFPQYFNFRFLALGRRPTTSHTGRAPDARATKIPTGEHSTIYSASQVPTLGNFARTFPEWLEVAPKTKRSTPIWP